jgi:CHAT domain-containing protein
MWQVRAPLLTAMRARHDAALIHQSDPYVRKEWDQLAVVRLTISRLMTELTSDFDARDKMLAKLGDEQEKLQRDLAPLLPDLTKDQEMASVTPRDLAANLPDDSAFVEFIRYNYWEKGKIVAEHYVAFFIAAGRDPVWIDLNKALPIDEAIDSWRGSIDRGEPSNVSANLCRLVWDPVAEHFPFGTKTVYLCTDGNLARLPFAALPGRVPGNVLLDDYALAVIPSGRFLLEQLLYPRSYSTDDKAFVVGDVAYGRAMVETVKYLSLNETKREAKLVGEAFGLHPDCFLAGARATPKAVSEGLCTARYAHIATHGYFDAEALTEDLRRFGEHLKTWEAGAGRSRERVGVGARSPLGYVGLALAGANDPKAAGILTGLDIVDLPLEDLKLCVLSACETGLGELTEGEGVAGLQRAFHVAGCPNVIGSLWKVDDKATAALMAQFYHELRVNKQPVIEALRRAQLTIYHHPEWIDSLAGDRARLAQSQPIRLKGNIIAPPVPKATPQAAPVKLWAAFVLSGVGL